MSAADGKHGAAPDPFAIDAGVPKIEGALRPKPKFSDRISSRVMFLAMGIAFGMVGIFFIALNAMDEKKPAPRQEEPAAKPKQTQAGAGTQAAPRDLTDGPGVDDRQGKSGQGKPSLVAATAASSPNDPLGLGTASGGVPSLSGGPGGAPGNDARSKLPPSDSPATGVPANNALGQSNSKLISSTTINQPPDQSASRDSRARKERSRDGGLSADSYLLDKQGSPSVIASTTSALLDRLKNPAGAPAGQQLGGAKAPDSEQDEKANFVKTAGNAEVVDDGSYLQHGQTAALSLNELQRGSFVPLRLETTLNSDQPGMVKARVTEDVYDTMSGCRLLVPAMTTVQGVYDSKVAVGQTRNLVVWNYMQFEDGSHLDLGGMQGYDSAGAAGIEADVNNHYLRLFSLAFGMSLVTAGVAESVPTSTSSTSTAQTPQQALSTALAQQYGQLGAQILGKQMQVQPTLKNYPGERFNIMLPLNVIFKKVWRNRCGGAQ